MMNGLDLLISKMAKCGLMPLELDVTSLVPGTIYNYCVEGDKPNRPSAWVICIVGIDIAVFGSFKTGDRETVHLNRPVHETWNQRQQQKYMHKRDCSFARYEKDLVQRESRTLAANRWKNARRAAASHPYLATKRVRPYGIRQAADRLLIPLRDIDGVLWSIQYIDGDGEKRFAKGGRINGCMHLIGDIEHEVIIAEGYATGATLHEITGTPVAVAFNAGNILPVAEAIRSKYPHIRIVIAADNDRFKKINTGLLKANEAAEKVHADVVLPKFPEGVPGTDFNDLMLGSLL
ncbi:toprim domain-containing protein [Parendozoicomonas haliclonae]|uniref:DNA primase TraC n=1 Tax=Parendozoicomonas haliclonae TaxID=1960125 RepID=A0A1X7AIN1_9GAMM|nr:toprim domain-containing protein [Parendozoicomonas haliclonae]SMA45539.1 DNA primase TraC [Parendozoicomonas haliclonae]